MRSKNKRQGKIRLTRIKPRTLLIVGLIGFVLFSFGPQVWRLRLMNAELMNLRQQLLELDQQHKELLAELESLETDGAIERTAREELGLVKPGEEVILPARHGQPLPLAPGEENEFRD